MPAPRPSQNAEAARAAALQAEFNEKKWVWVPDDKDGYLAGWVVKEEDDMGDVVMAAGGEVRSHCVTKCIQDLRDSLIRSEGSHSTLCRR